MRTKINWKRILSWSFAVLLTGALAASLGVWEARERGYRNAMENVYQRAYFDLKDSVGDMEQKLNKMRVMGGESLTREMLEDIRVQSELTASNLSQLSVKGQDVSEMVRFFNQLGDYCHAIAKKGGGLSEADREKMERLYAVLNRIMDAFQDVDADVQNGSAFFRSLNSGIAMLGDGYDRFNNDSSVDYPEMIYDGPFSDGLSDRNALFLKDKAEITADAGKTYLQKLFSDAEISHVGETKGNPASYLYHVGQNGMAEVSKAGGYLVSYSVGTENGVKQMGIEEGAEIASAFLKNAGFEKMSCVWVSEYEDSVYLNYAYTENGIVCYPDLVKIKVSLTDGKIEGVAAANYLYNHRMRELLDVGEIDLARAVVSEKLTVTEERLTLIPTEWNTEIIAYEFTATYQDSIYYVYIDAKELTEVRVMRVITQDGGDLLV